MSSKKFDILVLNAHPDDSEMAMGGTLLKLSKAGYRILNVCLTKGQAGTKGTPEEREKEFNAAQQFVGSTGLMLNYEDTKLVADRETVEVVTKLIRTHAPKVVFAPYYQNDLANFDGINNRDHSVCGEIAREAVKLARLKNAMPDLPANAVSQLLFYMIPVGVFPQMLFDVSDVIEDYKKLLQCYESQLKNYHLVDVLLGIRLTHGAVNHTKYAEAFVSDMPIRISEKNIFDI